VSTLQNLGDTSKLHVAAEVVSQFFSNAAVFAEAALTPQKDVGGRCLAVLALLGQSAISS